MQALSLCVCLYAYRYRGHWVMISWGWHWSLGPGCGSRSRSISLFVGSLAHATPPSRAIMPTGAAVARTPKKRPLQVASTDDSLVSTSTGGTPSKRQRTAKLISRERDTTAHDHDDADAASDSSITKQQASSVRAAVSLGEAVATLHSKSASLSSKLDMIEQLSSGFSSVGASGESLIELRNNHAFKVLLSFVISTLVGNKQARASTSVGAAIVDDSSDARAWQMLERLLELVAASLRQHAHMMSSSSNNNTNNTARIMTTAAALPPAATTASSLSSWFVVSPSLLQPMARLIDATTVSTSIFDAHCATVSRLLKLLLSPLFARTFCPSIDEIAIFTASISHSITKHTDKDSILDVAQQSLKSLDAAISQHPTPKKVRFSFTHSLTRGSSINDPNQTTDSIR